MHCRLELAAPPRFDLGTNGRNGFYRFLERFWMLQQVPLAAGLNLLGGWGWIVDGAGVQAQDVPWAALPTIGDDWHNNNRADPGSARVGLLPGQIDWGFGFIMLLARMGLASDIQTSETLAVRQITPCDKHRPPL